ncbi:hypothetical protein Ctob_006432 [Chrysochromulina tobinii]|uniref:Uncharacterized protein n=1 Tax=Chrysochromulina tobinii TaxID=1460289 RepID=A0A0M0JKN8_9EUKA|nr:hypothetical protein Ctob_006432 [Chrysochromulina tobinii]|eukprot:KOO26823.1 hypothetical protein Ctob_006432 [Chrysochromulina sp. CCMP291]
MRFPEAPEEQCAIVAHHWALDVWASETNVVADTSDDADAKDDADAEPSVSADRSGALPTECAGGTSLVVLDAFNMSCRVLHRGVEIALLKHAARDSASRGALLLALPLIPTTGERKGNQLMQRFVTRLHTWLDQTRPHLANAPASAPISSPRAPITAPKAPMTAPEAPITARFVRVFVGPRATPATALLLRASELEALDVSAWLDAVQDADDDEAEANHQRPSEGPSEGPSEMQAEAAAPDRPRCWDALLEHASQMRAGIVQEVVAAASRR